MDGDSISEGIICEKALCIYADLLMETPSRANRGWFKKFKHLSGIHIVVRHGKAASTHKEAAGKYVDVFCDFLNAGGYLPSNFLCANAGGNCKSKPMVIYHSENPRICKRNKVMKSNLPVMWQSNPNSWCTRQFL